MRDEKRLTAMLVPFYLGEQADAEGRMIQAIWTWDFEDLECEHDYIQWLFPLPERSSFNPDAPVVDQEVIQAFHANAHLRQNLLHSFTLMLKFYGLQGGEDNDEQFVVTKSEQYPVRKKEWICPLDHNYLRITRILKCLMVLGLESYAQSFYRCLEQIYREESKYIGGETFWHWTTAVNQKQMKDVIFINFDDLTSEQLIKLGLAGRMQSSVSDWMYLTPEMVKKLKLTPQQLSKARSRHP